MNKHMSDIMKKTLNEQQLTQAQFAKKMKWNAGQYVSNIVRGDCSIPVRRFKQFAKAAKCPIEDVIEAYLKDQRVRIEKLNGVKKESHGKLTRPGQFVASFS